MSSLPERRHRIVIAGGGASGVILAAHLLRDGQAPLDVTIVEQRPQLGRGVAYSTDLPEHLLNVTAPGMSAFQDDPEHFLRWLAERGLVAADTPNVFVPRRLFGQYLTDIADGVAAREAETGRFRATQARVMSATPAQGGVDVVLDDGSRIACDRLVLAVGHDEGSALASGIAVRPGTTQDTPLASDALVLILGTRLSMIDAWLSLRDAGHRGRIVAMSRRGLMPHVHLPTRTLAIDEADIPFGASMSRSLRWFRALSRRVEAAGGDWRDVVHGLRPFNQRIWRSWSLEARRRFLVHARPWWDIHRHRVPPEIHERMVVAIAAGELELLAARLVHVERRGEGFRAIVRPRGASQPVALDVARVYDCAGLARDAEDSSNPLIRSLVDQDLVRSDPLRLGLDVTPDGVLIGIDGRLCPAILAIGPLTRGALFEIEAVPDIRQQCAALAQRLIRQAAAAWPEA